MKTEIKSGEEVVLMWAVVRKEDYDKVVIPRGSFAKALEIGPVDELADQKNCKGWAAVVGVALARIGVKVAPERAQLLKAVPNANQSV